MVEEKSLPSLFALKKQQLHQQSDRPEFEMYADHNHEVRHAEEDNKENQQPKTRLHVSAVGKFSDGVNPSTQSFAKVHFQARHHEFEHEHEQRQQQTQGSEVQTAQKIHFKSLARAATKSHMSEGFEDSTPVCIQALTAVKTPTPLHKPAASSFVRNRYSARFGHEDELIL